MLPMLLEFDLKLADTIRHRKADYLAISAWIQMIFIKLLYNFETLHGIFNEEVKLFSIELICSNSVRHLLA